MLSDADRLQAQGSPAGLAWALGAYPDGERIGRSWIPHPHLLLLNDRLLAAAAGELPRLIVAMPPRHGKSELVSRYLPAWYLGRFPKRKVMLASYQAQFAASWGRKARDVLCEYGPELFGVRVAGGARAAEFWELEGHGGVMVSAGVGGALTGKGAHLLVIDDPIKNAEEAASELMREKAWNWWLSTARTRLAADAAVVLVMTRWQEDDLAGRLLAAQAAGEGDQWELLELPALCESDQDPLGREPGAALCPGLGFSERFMADTRRALGSYFFSALYQQRPHPPEGLLFKRRDFRYYQGWSAELAPDALLTLESGEQLLPRGLDHLTVFQTVDVAASEKESADYTVVATWAVTRERDLILLDVARQRFELLAVGKFIEREYRRYSPSFVGVEQFGHGLGVVQELNRKGLPIRSLAADKDRSRAPSSRSHATKSIASTTRAARRGCASSRMSCWRSRTPLTTTRSTSWDMRRGCYLSSVVRRSRSGAMATPCSAAWRERAL